VLDVVEVASADAPVFDVDEGVVRAEFMGFDGVEAQITGCVDDDGEAHGIPPEGS
jgi:hypothetical protein